MNALETDRTATAAAAPARVAVAKPAKKTIPATHCVGIVTAIDLDRFVVTSGGLVASGRRALSCLLEPAVGDTVACLSVAPNELWITSVLQREEGAGDHLLRLKGATRIDTGDAPLTVASGALDLRNQAFTLNTRQADVHADEASVSGAEFKLVARTMKLVGAALSTVFDRVTHYSKQHWRKTEGTDRVIAAYVEVEAQNVLRQKGEHVFLNGEKLVKAVGSQIHLG